MSTFAQIAKERGVSVNKVRLFDKATGENFAWHYWREKGGFLFESHDGEPRFSEGDYSALICRMREIAGNYDLAIDETIVSSADKVEIAGLIEQISALPFLSGIGADISADCREITRSIAKITGVRM